jgi:hypothetical protein
MKSENRVITNTYIRFPPFLSAQPYCPKKVLKVFLLKNKVQTNEHYKTKQFLYGIEKKKEN